MTRWPYYLLSLVFLAGLLVFDVSLLMRRQELKDQLDKQLRANIKTAVDHGDIEISSFGDVTIHNVVVYRSKTGSEPAFRCDRVTFGLSWKKLIRGEVELDSVALDHPTLFLRFDEKGEIDLPTFIESTDTKARSMKLPAARIDDLAIVAANVPGMDATRPAQISGIDVKLVPRLSRTFAYSFEGDIEDPVFGTFSVEGAFGEAPLRATVRRQSFALTPQMIALLSPDLRTKLAPIRMSGSFDLLLELNAKDRLDKIDYLATATARDVTLAYGDVPASIKNFNGVVTFKDGYIVGDDVEFELYGGLVKLREARVDFKEGFPRFDIAGRVSALRLDASVAESIGKFEDPGPTIRDVLEALDADGFVDIEIDLRRHLRDDRVAVNVLVLFRKTNLTFRGFLRDDGTRDGYPYPLHNVVGTVRVTNDECVFTDVRSNDKDPDITADGVVTFNRKGFSYDIRVRGQAMRLDQKVRDCLQESQRPIFDDYNPDGPADFTLAVTREKGEFAPSKVDLVIDLLGVAVLPRVFPYRLDNVEGRLKFGDPAGVKLENLRAKHADASIGVGGLIKIRDDGKTEFKLDINSQHLPLDDDLLTAARREFPNIADRLEPFNFRGRADISCSVSNKAEFVNTFDIDLAGAACDLEDKGLTFTDMHGPIRVRGSRVEIDRIEMKLRMNSLTADGWIQLDDVGSYEITLDAPELLIDKQFMQRVGEKMPTIAALNEKAEVEGKARMTVIAKKNERGEAVKTNIDADGMTIRGVDHPFEFQRVYGKIEINAPNVDFTNFTLIAPCGGPGSPEAQVNIRSGYVRERKGKSYVILSGIDIVGVVVDDAIYPLLGPTIGEQLKSLAVKGVTDARVDTFEIHPDRYRFSGRLKPRGVKLNAGFPIDWISGDVIVDEAVVTDDAVAIHGWFEKGMAKMGPFQISEIATKFDLEGGALEFPQVSARMLDGVLDPSGTSLRFDLAAPHDFDARVSLIKARLAALLTELEAKKKDTDGVATVQASLEGNLDLPESYTGRGSMRIRGRKLYETQFFNEILKILNFDFLAGPDAPHEGKADFRIAESKVLIDSASVVGPGVNLEDGGGTIGFDGNCNLAFDLEGLTFIDHIPLVGQIFSFGRSFLLKSVHVTGPISNPSASLQNRISEMMTDDPKAGTAAETINPQSQPSSEKKK